MRVYLMFCVDVLLILAATILAIAIRDDLSLTAARISALSPYIEFSVAGGALAVAGFGLHKSIWRLSSRRDLQPVMLAAAATVTFALAATFVLTRAEALPRSVPLLQFALIAGLMAGARSIIRRVVEMRRSRRTGYVAPTEERRGGPAASSVLVVGLNAIAELYLHGVHELASGGVEVAGLLGRHRRHIGHLVQSHPVLGVPEEVERVLAELEVQGVNIDRIVVAIPEHKLSPEARAALSRIQTSTSIEICSLADNVGLNAIAHAAPARAQGFDPRGFAYTAGELALVARSPYLAVKRPLDGLGALVLLLVLSPLLVLVAVLVAVDVGLPVFFRQRRPGRKGRVFRLFKFRTMHTVYDVEDGRIADQQRISRIGRLLRRSRLDELPQLLNILIGDMSFVGPRPLLPVDQHPEYRVRLLVRPGLTGWAQVAGGRAVDAADKAAMDIWYVRHATLLLDLRIMWATFSLLLHGDGETGRINRRAIEDAWHDLDETGIVARGARQPH